MTGTCLDDPGGVSEAKMTPGVEEGPVGSVSIAARTPRTAHEQPQEADVYA